jgi:hypothetical protein
VGAVKVNSCVLNNGQNQQGDMSVQVGYSIGDFEASTHPSRLLLSRYLCM